MDKTLFMNLHCGYCLWQGIPNLEEVGPHTKATCPICKKYIKFVSKKELETLVEKENTHG